MTIEIFEYNTKKATEPLRLKLILEGGEVTLVGVDHLGDPINGQYILKITREGTLHLFKNISQSVLDLKTGKERKIKIDY